MAKALEIFQPDL